VISWIVVPALRVMTHSSGKYSTTPEYDDVLINSASVLSAWPVILRSLSSLTCFCNSAIELMIKIAPTQGEVVHHDEHAYFLTQHNDEESAQLYLD